MKIAITVGSNIAQTARVVQLLGMFDIPPSKRSEISWDADLPIEEKDWNVGLIVGPSGCGKSQIARGLFAKSMREDFPWPKDKACVDGFPTDMGIKDIVELLSAVGFSSPPAWLRPYGVLSTGQQFRVHLARLLAEKRPISVVDEYSSTVDRTVAKIGSAALEKTVRRRGQKFIAVTCHEDVESYLNPDWVFRPAELRFGWRLLQRRPQIDLVVQRVHPSAWQAFARHHYLSSDINRSAVCFVAFWDGIPVAFHASLPFFGRTSDGRKARRNHRTVCLPDYQGVGIGNALSTYCSSAWAGLNYRVFSATAHPAHIRTRAKSEDWKLTRVPGLTSRDVVRKANVKQAKAVQQLAKTRATDRLTAGFEYVGAPMPKAKALALMHDWADEPGVARP